MVNTLISVPVLISYLLNLILQVLFGNQDKRNKMTRITRIDKAQTSKKVKTPKNEGSLIRIAKSLEKTKNNDRKVEEFQSRVNALTAEKKNDPRIGRLISEARKDQHGNFFQWLSMIAQGQQLPAEESVAV